MGGDHGNLINGRWRAAGPGEGFAVAGAIGEELARRPRSTAQELEEALGVLADSSQGWWEREARERAEAVRAMDVLAALGDGAGDFGARVGLDEAGALALLSEDLGREDALEPVEVSGPGARPHGNAAAGATRWLRALCLLKLYRGRNALPEVRTGKN